MGDSRRLWSDNSVDIVDTSNDDLKTDPKTSSWISVMSRKQNEMIWQANCAAMFSPIRKRFDSFVANKEFSREISTHSSISYPNWTYNSCNVEEAYGDWKLAPYTEYQQNYKFGNLFNDLSTKMNVPATSRSGKGTENVITCASVNKKSDKSGDDDCSQSIGSKLLSNSVFRTAKWKASKSRSRNIGNEFCSQLSKNEDVSFITYNGGDNTEKNKLKFTKKLYHLFSQSSFHDNSKRKKLVMIIVVDISEATSDNIIHLITILSVELMLTTVKLDGPKPNNNDSLAATKSNGVNLCGSSLSRYKLTEKLKKKNGTSKSDSNKPSWNKNDRTKMMRSLDRSGYQDPRSWSSVYSRERMNSRGLSEFSPKLRSRLSIKEEHTYKKLTGSNSNFDVSKKSNLSPKNIQPELSDHGDFKITIPIIGDINLLQLNDIFLLKDDLFSGCNKSLLYIQPKHSVDGNRISESWSLQIVSPTSLALNQSLQLTASRFPEWNLQLCRD